MDFGSLLNQFQQDASRVSSSSNQYSRSPAEDDSTKARKRQRLEVDAASFPVVSEIYCVCPAGVQTGGPEALHQLCHELNSSERTVSAYMLYVRSDGRSVSFASHAIKPVAYHCYNAPTNSLNALNNASLNHLLIWPECWTDEMLHYLASGGKAQCAVWWLSVNNNTRRFREWKRRDIVHFHQSEYAKQHLKTNGATHVFPLTEYIREQQDETSKEETIDRPIDVLYNTVKGMHYTDEIINRSGSTINFRPIGGGVDGQKRISPEEVRKLLLQAKIYIDFGPHPGMDRLPREAALAGCVVVTNAEGAAQYDQDVPLPASYKIESFNVDDIHKLLQDVLQDFEKHTKEMNDYRKWINCQKDKMHECVESLLEEVVDKRAKRK